MNSVTVLISAIGGIFIIRRISQIEVPDWIAKALGVQEETAIAPKGNELASAITIKPDFTPAFKEQLFASIMTIRHPNLSGWENKQIEEIRRMIQPHALNGLRAETIAGSIQKRFKLDSHTAKRIAQSEVQLVLTKLRQVRHQGSGITEYKWQCVGGTTAHPVRPMHKALDARSRAGEVFRFDDPPVANEQGDKLNPGEDEGCRCIARPVIKFK